MKPTKEMDPQKTGIKEKTKELYPVQQNLEKEPLSEKTIKEAVRELNPDEISLDSRG